MPVVRGRFSRASVVVMVFGSLRYGFHGMDIDTNVRSIATDIRSSVVMQVSAAHGYIYFLKNKYLFPNKVAASLSNSSPAREFHER
jgi:hypothetical protein